MLAVLLLFNAIGYLGIKGERVERPYRIALEIDHGLIIIEVFEDSPAERAGLEVGDIVLRVGDREVSGLEDLTEMVRDHPGERLRFKIKRGGKTRDILIEIGEKEEIDDRIREEIRKFIRQLKDEIERLKDGRI